MGSFRHYVTFFFFWFQAPLSSRIYSEDQELLPLIQKSQICSTRYNKQSDETILVCDFMVLDDLKMEDFGIEMIHKYVDLKRELINTYKLNSLGIYKKIFIENMDIKNLHK